MPLSHRRLQYVGVRRRCPSATTAKILIVDDDEGVTQTFARMLRLEGYQVRTAVNAETGLREAEAEPSRRHHPRPSDAARRRAGFLRRLRAHDDQRATPVAIVTGDYFLDDAVSNELRSSAPSCASSRSGSKISSASPATSSR